MADSFISVASQYATVHTASTSTGLGSRFGFQATQVTFRNDGGGSIYVTLASTSGSTSAGYQVSSGEEHVVRGISAGSYGIALTSTTNITRVGAWG